jgi:hypothetical protein
VIEIEFDDPDDHVRTPAQGARDLAAKFAEVWQRRDELDARSGERHLRNTVRARSVEDQVLLNALEHATEDPRFGDGLRQLREALRAAMPWHDGPRRGEVKRVPLSGEPHDRPTPET